MNSTKLFYIVIKWVYYPYNLVVGRLLLKNQRHLVAVNNRI